MKHSGGRRDYVGNLRKHRHSPRSNPTAPGPTLGLAIKGLLVALPILQ